MISDEGKGKEYVEEQEAEMIGALKQLESGRKAEEVAREVGVEAHSLCLEGEIRRNGMNEA